MKQAPSVTRPELQPLPTALTIRLGRLVAEVEALLADWLSPDIQPGEIARPERLLMAMRAAMLGGGKRLRPFLTVETASLLGCETALRTGAAIELLHGYSLVHDDLPAMDDDDWRRGKPTLHRAFDEATAILAGDALQSLAFEKLADPATDPDPAIRAELVLGLARAAGLGGMAGGQMLDLAAEGRFGTASLDEDSIRRLQGMKTGAILAFSVEAGGILGKASPGQREKLRLYGHALGAAFQIADDLLDREGDAAILGKNVSKDAGKGKGTLVDRLGLEVARGECHRLVQEACEALSAFGSKADLLRETACFVAVRRF